MSARATPVEARPAMERAFHFTPLRGEVPKGAEGLRASQKQAEGLLKVKQEKADPKLVLIEGGKLHVKPVEDETWPELGNKLKLEGKNTPAVVQELQNFATYADIQSEVQRTGMPIEKVLQLHNLEPAQWQQLRKDVLTRMGGMDVIKNAVPGLNEIQPQETQIAYLEAYLGADPALRKIIVDRVQAITQKAREIPDVPTFTNEVAAKKKDKLNKEKGQTLTELRDKLKIDPDKITDEQIEAMMRGKTAGEATTALFDKMLIEQGIDPLTIRSYDRLQRIQEEITEQEKVSNAKSSNPDVRKAAAEKVVALKSERVRVQSDFDTLSKGSSVKFDEQLDTYRQLELKIQGREYGGQKTGGVAKEMDSLVKNVAESQRLESFNAPTPEEQKLMAERKNAQENLTRELEGVMTQAVTTVLVERYDRMVETEHIKMEADARDAEARHDEAGKQATKRVEKAMNEDWVVYKPNEQGKIKENINRKNIGESMRVMAAEAAKGQDGSKRLILRALTSDGDQSVIKLIDADGKPLMVADGKGGLEKATWETVQYEQLTPENQKLLIETHQKHGEGLTKKLFGDYYYARQGHGIKDAYKLAEARSQIGLDKNTVKLLFEYYGPKLVAGRDAAEKKNNLDAVLKEKGIKPGSEFSLMFALLAMFGGIGKKKDEMMATAA